MARVKHTFDSPSSYKACTNSNVKVVYDSELRHGARMSGAFCINRTIKQGEFICAWNGRQIKDDDDVERLTNIYDLTKYALSFPSGRKKELLYSAPRLDKYGRPKPLPEREEDVIGDPRDVSLAVFLNEPSPDFVAIYKDETVSIERKRRNSANVCMRTEKHRNGIVCPLMFASRDIHIGDELTWDYGAVEYDRRFYTIDEEQGVFEVSEDKYSATEDPQNMCRITCDTVAFRNGLVLEPFSPDLFLLDADNLTNVERRHIVFRSDRYLPDRHASDNSTIDTASINSDSTIDVASVGDGTSSDQSSMRPLKRQRRRGPKLQRRTITVKSMQDEELSIFIQQRQILDRFANDILHRLNAVKGNRRVSQKLRIIAILKRIIQPAVYRVIEATTALGYVLQFPRTEFVLTKVDGLALIMNDNDVLWKDVIKMQHMVFLAIDSTIESLKAIKDSTDDIYLKFAPNTLTSIYIRPDGTKETVSDWSSDSFRQDHPTTHRVAMQFLNKMQHISNSIKNYNTWHRRLEEFEAKERDYGRRDDNVDLVWQKGRAFINLALDMLHNNAYEQINDPKFINVSDSIIKTLVESVKYRPINPVRTSEDLKQFRDVLFTLRDHSVQCDVVLANQMLEALQEPLYMWRSESMLSSLSSHRMIELKR